MEIKKIVRALYSINADLEVFEMAKDKAAYNGAVNQLHDLMQQLEKQLPKADSYGDNV